MESDCSSTFIATKRAYINLHAHVYGGIMSYEARACTSLSVVVYDFCCRRSRSHICTNIKKAAKHTNNKANESKTVVLWLSRSECAHHTYSRGILVSATIHAHRGRDNVHATKVEEE